MTSAPAEGPGMPEPTPPTTTDQGARPGQPDRPDQPALPEAIRAVVAGVPGVTAVYPTHPAPVAALSHAIASLGPHSAAGPVAVDAADDGIEVAVTIGVTDRASAAATCRAVYDAVAAYLSTTATAGDEIAPASRIRVLVATVG
ncbi:hypothetical protein ACEXOS_021910 [Herbiconiux sp. P16]|uniref:hypothetical protein n=1 Tax=Herbiconiux wuyangfengii TaxID=3342794 RepID=UPI0035B7B78A